MFSLLSGIPGADELRTIVRKVDTARHHGVPHGCVLELDLQSVPQESGGGFDPLALINGAGRPLLLREAIAAIHRAADDDRVAGLIAKVQLPAVAAGPIQELVVINKKRATRGNPRPAGCECRMSFENKSLQRWCRRGCRRRRVRDGTRGRAGG